MRSRSSGDRIVVIQVCKAWFETLRSVELVDLMYDGVAKHLQLFTHSEPAGVGT
jgi:hypothetical protein